MEKAVETFLNFFISFVCGAVLGICFGTWLLFLKGHPLRRKVLGEFALLALATLFLLILWHLTRDLREAEKMATFLVIVGIYFLGYLIFYIWFFSSGWAFFAPFRTFMRLIKGKIRSTQEFYKEVDEVLRKSIEDFSKRRLFHRVSQFLGILMPIGVYLSIFLMIHNLTSQFLMPDVLYAKISDRDEFLALYVSSPKDEELKGEFLILSLPDKRVVERLSVREGDRLKVLGWLNDTIWVEKTEGISLFLLSWRREDGHFRFNKQSFPPERYELFHLLGYPPHLFAVLRGGEKIARLRERDGKWEEDAIFTAPKGLKNWEELRQFLWSWDGKPFYVLMRASKSGSSYKIGVASPGEEARWLYSRVEDKQAMLDSSTCFSFGDRFYLLLQEVRQDSGRSSQFFLAEVSPQRVKVRKLISDVYYIGELFNAVPTKDGFLVLYPNSIGLKKNKSYIFIVPPKGEWRAIEWRRKGFMMAVALKTQNKVLLFSEGRIFLLDAETGMCEDFASIKELLKERSKNAGI